MLLSPGFQPLVRFFDICKQPRIFERRSPDRHDRPHAVPHHPDLSVAFEKQLVVDQPAVHDARHHLPITDHHPYISVFFASLRIFFHHVFHRRGMEMFHEPCARLPQSRFAPHVVQPQHQVDFVIAYLRHVSLLALVRPLAPCGKFSAFTCPSLPQCLAVEVPSAHAASTRGTPRPAESARSALANEPWFQCDRMLVPRGLAVHPPMPATRMHRHATLPPRSPKLAMSFPAASPHPPQCRRMPATSLGSNCSPSAFRRLKPRPARPVRLAPVCVAKSIAPHVPPYPRLEWYRPLQTDPPSRSVARRKHRAASLSHQC